MEERVVFRSCFAAWLCLAIAGGLLVAGAGAEEDLYSRFIARTQPLPPAEQRERFHLPPGFDIQLVAAEPDIRKPINLNFDAGGRLLATGSVEYPHPAKEGTAGRDTIQVLSDTNRDGLFDEVKAFAGGLNIPVGVTPVGHGVLGYSIPNILRFVDRDGDGRADDHEIVYRDFGFQDTQGMPSSFTWWIDGWVYACHGDINTSTVAGADGKAITMQGGSTFRMRPDGSSIEHFAHGQANPFGLCFDPLGDLYSADSNSRPAYLLQQGAWYPGLVARHDGLGFGPAIMRHFHGSTGIAGIACYAADQFPAEYHGTLFIGNPVTGRINHDRLEVHGSTYQAIEQPDFLACDDPWFRPVDVQLGPDGALYIADFYNRIIAHTQVPLSHVERDRERGRIWRVVYRGQNGGGNRPEPIPDLAAASLEALLDWLRHPNLTVRTHATHQLAERIGGAAAGPIKRLMAGESHPWQRVHGLWVLHRLGLLDNATISRLANDADRAVRVHLMKALAERRDWKGERSQLHRLVLGKLVDPDAFVRRAAAGGLARHPSEVNIQPLLKLWADTPAEDSLLVHGVRTALRDNLRALGSVKDVAKRSSADPDDHRRLADVSLGIPAAHSADFLLDHLRSRSFDTARLEEFMHHVTRWSDIESLPAVYDFAETFRGAERAVQAAVLRSLYRAGQERGMELPRKILQWGLGLSRHLLESNEEFSVYCGIELAWDLKLTELGGQLAKLAERSSPQPPLRSFAIDALGTVDRERALGLLDRFLGDASEPLDIREKAADTLGRINNDQSREVLNRRLAVAPGRVAVVIARGLAHDRRGAELLLQAISQGQASARLLQDAVVEQYLLASNPPELEIRLAKLLARLPPQDEALRRIVQQYRIGFAESESRAAIGEIVFEKHCGICHQIEGKGTKVGPALDGVGLRGLERILEDTLDPNRTVDQSFRSSVIRLANGRIVTGLVLREEGKTVVLADAEGKNVHIPSHEIENRLLSTLSPMPANAAEQIPEQDFYHLIAYLLSQRQPVEGDKKGGEYSPP